MDGNGVMGAWPGKVTGHAHYAKQIREKLSKEKDWIFAVCEPGFHGSGKPFIPVAENLEPEGGLRKAHNPAGPAFERPDGSGQ